LEALRLPTADLRHERNAPTVTEEAVRHTKGAERRQQIIDAAIQEFGLKGVQAARIEDIATRAGCNKSLVYYYFSSKEQLSDAVTAEVMRSHEVLWKKATFPEWVRFTIDWAWQHPDDPWIRMMVQEGLTDGGRVLLEDERARALGEATRVVVRGQGSGDVDPDIDPEMVTLLVLILAIGPRITPQLARMLAGVPADDPAFHERFVTFVEELIERLRPPSR
jgi:TetR/AcrR family transcriptional regulator